MKKTLFLLLVFGSFHLQAQTGEEEAVRAVINNLFDGMRVGDSSLVRSVFHPSARLQTTYIKEGIPILQSETIDKFIQAVGTPHNEIWDEKIWSLDIHIDGNLATAWTDYTFYIDKKMSHCGVNAFHLFKSKEGWKITQITDTRRRENCQTEASDATAEIDTLLNNWHKAAATADEEVFFGSMAPGAIYLGTDASEKWEKEVFEEWSKKYFERETAWSFTPKNREIYFSKNGKTAWFDELLDTWMGICRGSGVLQKEGGGWKLVHYNLAIMMPNDRVQDFLKMMKAEGDK